MDAPKATNAPDERGLLAALRAGDEAAYATLVRTHGGALLRVARRIVQSEEDARDVVQDAFLAAFRAIDRFEAGARLSTWLHRITVNAALMRLRTRRRRPEESLDDLLPEFVEDGHHAAPIPTWAGSAAALVEHHEARRHVRAAIDRLPEPHRSVLVLRDIEELDTAEAARVLGITPNAVKTRLHRARQALRALLAPHFEEPS